MIPPPGYSAPPSFRITTFLVNLSILFILFIFHSFTGNLEASGSHSLNETICGFWKGPHPDLKHVNFIFHISSSDNGSLRGEGFWVNQGLYQAGFSLDSISLHSGHIHIRIPDWICRYDGEISESDNMITGKFDCSGEPTDSVLLQRINPDDLHGLFPEHLSSDGNFIYHYHKPSDEQNGLPGASLNEAGCSIETAEEMIRKIGEGDYGRIHSFIMIKNSRLVCEEYFYGFSRNVLHPLESVTKSITSLVFGIAIDRYKIGNPDISLLEYFPQYDSSDFVNIPRIRIRHLLTMTSGLSFDENRILFISDRIKYLLSCPSVNKPGADFNYNAGNTELLGAIIRQATGLYADQFARQYLFKPLGITEYRWDTYKQNGYPLCGGALWLRPIDMAKIGLMVLKKGRWKDRQIISEQWIEESTMPHVVTGIGSDRYGYQWWISDIPSGDRSYRLIWANGLGSQFIFIFPELDMIIVTTGGNWKDGNNGKSWDIFRLFEKYLSVLNSERNQQ